MKLVSISGFVCLVKDLDKTVQFYEQLGFVFSDKDKTPDFAKAYLNWFWMEFVVQDKAEKAVFQKQADLASNQPSGAGIFIHISVDNVDEIYQSFVSKGLKPSSEPTDYSWGRREFVIRDPDGYKLVFFKKN